MRLIGVLTMAIAGSIVSFYSVLALLDEGRVPEERTGDTGRVGAFATPGLSAALPVSLADLRPYPVTTAPQSLEALGQSAQPTPSGTALAEKVRSAQRSPRVLPITRRLPSRPETGETSLAAAIPSPAASVPATAKLAARKPTFAFDQTTRSALGGPAPEQKPAKTANIRAPRVKPAATLAPASNLTP